MVKYLCLMSHFISSVRLYNCINHLVNLLKRTIMRTIKSTLMALVLLVGTTLTAANPIVDKVNKDEASKEIAQLLDDPDFEFENGTAAIVTLMVNSEGEMVILSVSTEDRQIENYIKSRLDHQKLENTLETGKTYELPITFNFVK